MQQPSNTRLPSTPDLIAARQLAESNATTNHFLGATRRPWMPTAVAIPSVPAERAEPQSRPRSSSPVMMRNVPVSTASERHSHDVCHDYWDKNTGTLQPSQNHGVSHVAERIPANGPVNDSARKRSFDVANLERNTNHSPTLQQMEVPRPTTLLPSLAAVPTTCSQLNVQQSAATPGNAFQARQPLAMHKPQSIATLAMNCLDNFQKRIGRLSEIELQRFSLLREACDQSDSFYLCMHQIFCVQFLDPRRTVVTGFGEEQYAGLNLLTLILLSNQDLSAEVVKFFSNLPAPLGRLMDDSIEYRNIVAQVRIFLRRLAVLWDTVRETSFVRESPPFADELIEVFEVHSPVMQKVLFNSIHRQVGGTDDATWSRAGLMLFTENQTRHQARRTDGANKEFRTRDAILAERKVLEEQYKSLRTAPANLPLQNVPPGFIVTAGQQNPLPRSTSHNQNASNPNPSRPASVQSAHPPHGPLQQQQSSSAQWPTTLNPPSRSQSATALGANTELANTGGSTGPSSTSRTQQFPSPMNPLNLLQISTPRGLHHPPMTPQRRRGLPPLSNRPTIPRTSTTLVQHNGQGRGLAQQPSVVQATPNPIMLIPALGHESFQTSNPNANRLALHQAHLRSPVTEKLTAVGQRSTDIRLYQYFNSFALPPKFLDGKNSLLSWHFQATAPEVSKKASDVISSDGYVKRLVCDGCTKYRIRSVEVPEDVEMIEEADWSVKDTSWPPWCFLRINQVDLELRRKSHHGKDLPVDVTPHVRQGANSVTIAFLAAGAAKGYALAVEKIGIGDQARVESAGTMLAAEESLRSIMQGLTNSSNGTTDGDDEVQIADSHISIDLVDPFMATIFDIPARGKACTHRECFDLSTFFQTRGSSPDEWKCPICKRDVRPQSLIVDGFLKSVRESLVASGVAADARAILISRDGSWNVKKKGGDTTTNKTREDSIATVAASPATSKDTVRGDASRSQSVVIEIEDD